MTGFRLAKGGLIDRSTALNFKFSKSNYYIREKINFSISVVNEKKIPQLFV